MPTIADINAKPNSILVVHFPAYSVVGYARPYKGLSLVPGENGAASSRPHPPYQNITGYKELTPRPVKPETIRVGDIVRLTMRDVEIDLDTEEVRAYPDYNVVGFARGNDDYSLSLAPGVRGFPTRHPRSGIEEYALLE